MCVCLQGMFENGIANIKDCKVCNIVFMDVVKKYYIDVSLCNRNGSLFLNDNDDVGRL